MNINQLIEQRIEYWTKQCSYPGYDWHDDGGESGYVLKELKYLQSQLGEKDV